MKSSRQNWRRMTSSRSCNYQPGGRLTRCQSLKVKDGGKGHTSEWSAGSVNVAYLRIRVLKVASVIHWKNPSQLICCTRLPLSACKALDNVFHHRILAHRCLISFSSVSCPFPDSGLYVQSLCKGVTGAEQVDTHLGAEEVHTLLWHVRFLIRGFMHKGATSTLCLSQRDHIGLRTVPLSFSCRPDRKSLIFATEQKLWNFFLKLPLNETKCWNLERFLDFGANFEILHVHA